MGGACIRGCIIMGGANLPGWKGALGREGGEVSNNLIGQLEGI